MVCRDSSAAAALGAEASEFRRREEGADVGDTGAVVFRVGLEQAMFLIMAQDENRRVKEEEASAFMEEEFGSEDKYA